MIFLRFEEPVDCGKVSDLLSTNLMKGYSMSTVGFIYQARGVMSKFDPPGRTWPEFRTNLVIHPIHPSIAQIILIILKSSFLA